MKKGLFFALLILIWPAITMRPAMADVVSLFGEPLALSGYLTQGAAFSLRGDHYDTERDLQSALFNLFLEGQYKPTQNLQFYVSGKFTEDWIYDLKHNEHAWKDKLFSDKWRFTMGGLIFEGVEKGKSFELFENKDQVYFKIEYRWS